MCIFIVLQYIPFPPSGQGQASPYHSRMLISVPSVTLSANITISLKFLCQCFSNLILNPVSFESFSFQILHCLKNLSFSASILTHLILSFSLLRLLIASHRFPALPSPARFSPTEGSQSRLSFYGGQSAGSAALFLLKGRLL